VHEDLLTADLEHLQGARCAACKALMFPVRGGCPGCGAPEVEPLALSDHGTVWTFTVIHIRPPGYLGPCPYVLGVVELDDGLRVTSIVTADDVEDVRIGDRVGFELIDVGTPDTPRLTFAHRRMAGRRR
jgi:uncharacterized OB-fold protein